MFCKKCGKELAEGVKFCPACGQKTGYETSGKKTVFSRVKKEILQEEKRISQKRGFSKRKRAGLIGLAAVLAAAILVGVIAPRFTGGKSDDIGFDKEKYKGMSFSRSQVGDLEEIYQASYEDEKKGLDLYIAAYAEHYDEYEDIHTFFDSLDGMTEDLYQAMNEFDPGLKDAVATDAGDRFGGDSYLGSYVVSNGVSAVLSDSEFGQECRNVIEDVVLGGLELLTLASAKEDRENAIQSDAMLPIAVGGDYTIARSNGTVENMLDELKMVSGYTLAVQAINERLGLLADESPEYGESYEAENQEELFETYKIIENYHGREDALEERKQEWDDNLCIWADEYLVRLGIEDREAAIEEMLLTEDERADKEMLRYFEISDEEYERLTKKYETDDVGWILDEIEGADAIAEYEEKRQEGNLEEEDGLQWKTVYSIIDKEGTVHSSFLVKNSSLHATINEEGMCSIWADAGTYRWEEALVPWERRGENDEYCVYHCIMDKDGNVLFQNESDKKNGDIYYDVTASGKVLKKSFETDKDRGEENEVITLVSPEGEEKKLLEGMKINLEKRGAGWEDDIDYTDYYSFECESHDGTDTEGVIEVSTGKIFTPDEFEEREQEEQSKNDSDLLNENYRFFEDAICEKSGKVVKDLSKSGGVSEILYTGGRYWVITRENWYYVLDEDFQEILKPVQLEDYSYPELTEYGLLACETKLDEEGEDTGKKALMLYDEKGEKEELVVRNGGPLDVDNYLCRYGGSVAINLQSKEPLILSTPEKPTLLELK